MGKTIKAGKIKDAPKGRAPVLSKEATDYIKSLINVHKPETKKEILKLTHEWLRLKQVSLGRLHEHDISKTVSDRVITNFITEEINRNGAKKYVPDTNTDARDRETKDA